MVARNGVKKLNRPSYSTSTTNWYDIRAEVLVRDKRKCQHRGCEATSGLEVHHIIPLSRGGRSVKTNLITLCEHHHETRHDHLAKSRRT